MKYRDDPDHCYFGVRFKYLQDEKVTRGYIMLRRTAELEENNKRFFISHVAGEVNFDRVKDRSLWLSDAGVVLPVYNVTEPKAPLNISEKRNLFKLFLSDVASGYLSGYFTVIFEE